jgi:2-polyprenyl-3-methyl-5-hydroxy-6-metoxy-1,4-benzoquinol methylase
LNYPQPVFTRSRVEIAPPHEISLDHSLLYRILLVHLDGTSPAMLRSGTGLANNLRKEEQEMAINEGKMNELVGRFLNDFGGSFQSALAVIGDKLGLYKALAGAGTLTSEELAERTGTNERYVREWLASQAAGGYVSYEAATGGFYLTEEQALVLTDENGPVFLPGAFQLALATVRSEPRIATAFKTGEGVGWHEHDAGLFGGTERFFRPGYATNLVGSWIPALEGLEAKLKAGGKVADVGCGLGASTILMAQAYPKSTFVGFDYHQSSVEQARSKAHAAGVSDRVSFEVAKAKDYPGTDYDMVAFFDSLHDMGDPVGAAKHVLGSLKSNGSWMIVEPFANDRVEDNLNPIGRIFYSASTMLCTPGSRSQEVRLGLGAQAGEARIRDVVTTGGFKRFRRATETPFNLVFEARP